MRRLFWCLAAFTLGCLPLCGFAAAPSSNGTEGCTSDVSRRTAKPLPLTEVHDKKAIVVVFLSFECPVSTSYSRLLSILASQYAAEGVSFVGVCTNAEINQDELARRAKEFRLSFPVYAIRIASGRCLSGGGYAQAFVLDSTHTLRYRGRIDNAYAAVSRRIATSRSTT